MVASAASRSLADEFLYFEGEHGPLVAGRPMQWNSALLGLLSFLEMADTVILPVLSKKMLRGWAQFGPG